MTNTKDIGDRTEAIILAELLKAGYTVLLPFGDNNRYDMVVDVGGKFIRIQCKTGTPKNGCVMFPTASVYRGKGGMVKRQYTKDEIDLILVYSREYGKIYVVSVGELSRGSMKLRVEKTKDKIDYKHIKWAKSYEFDGRLLER